MRIHFIELEDNKNVVYLPNSMRFFIVNDKDASIIKNVDSGMSYQNIKEVSTGFSEFSYNYIIFVFLKLALL